MKTATIEDLAYVIKKAKENNQPKPIFFLGAGASVSGGVPLASEIIKDIITRYSDSPKVKKLDALKAEEKTYAKYMEALEPYERNKLLKGYIDNAKINVTHIYLAQLMVNGYVDYVLTVNFDNLMLRALALFNEFPPTHDMAVLKDLTTTKFKEKSVVYLHGQHHGLWLLNTKDEMDKVKETVPRIFDSIKDGRPWVFIGYSGEDPIFEHIKKLGRFDHGLYWGTYYDNDPIDKVKKYLEKPNTNASIIKGFDADSFLLKLNVELGIKQPKIIDRPFTALKEMLDNVVDIDDQEHFENVKERLGIANQQVCEAIDRYEYKVKGRTDIELESELIRKEIINIIIYGDYTKEKIDKLESIGKELNNEEVNDSLSSLYHHWGSFLTQLAEETLTKEFFNRAIEKYRKAIEIRPDYYKAYYNLSCTYALILNKEKALKYLDISLANDKGITPAFVKADDNWAAYRDDQDWLDLLAKYE